MGGKNAQFVAYKYDIYFHLTGRKCPFSVIFVNFTGPVSGPVGPISGPVGPVSVITVDGWILGSKAKAGRVPKMAFIPHISSKIILRSRGPNQHELILFHFV